MSETHKTGALADGQGEVGHGSTGPDESRSDRLNRNSEVRACDQMRDEIAESLADELFRRKYGRDEVPESFDQSRKATERQAVDAVLASDVLAAYVASKQAEALREAAEYCTTANWTGPASTLIHLNHWLNVTADRIANPEAGA